MCKSSSEVSRSHNEDNLLLGLNELPPVGGCLEARSSIGKDSETRKTLRSEASTSLRRWGFFSLIRSLRMPTFSVLGILTGNVWSGWSPSTKHLRQKSCVESVHLNRPRAPLDRLLFPTDYVIINIYRGYISRSFPVDIEGDLTVSLVSDLSVTANCETALRSLDPKNPATTPS